MRKMESALDNLTLAATSNKATMQQLMAANLDLTTTVSNLTATNKKLANAAAKKKGRPAPGEAVGASATPGEGWTKMGITVGLTGIV